LTSRGPARGRIPQLELLRAIAMAGIFVFHLWSVVPNIAEDGIIGKFVGYAGSFGYLGVVLFNFITGFVLALPYLGLERRELPAYPGFLRRRFKRIAPKYYLALTFWLGLLLLLGKGRSGSLLFDYLAHLSFIHSILPSSFFAIVPAYWWLGLLAQFYLLFPLLLRFFRKVGAARACLLVCMASWGCWIALDQFSHPGSRWALVNYMWYYNLPARLPEFVLGMWLAEAWQIDTYGKSPPGASPHNAIPLGYLTFVAAMLLFALIAGSIVPVERLPFRHISMISFCLAGIVAVLMFKLSGWLGQSPITIKFAAASYSIYLLHQPLLGYANRMLGHMLQPLTAFFLLLILVGTISFCLAAALDQKVR